MKSTLTGNMVKLLLMILTLEPFVTPTFAQDDSIYRQKIDALLVTWGTTCENAITDKFPTVNRSDIIMEVEENLRQSIEARRTTLRVLKEQGASFTWQVPNEEIMGYCIINGNGQITDFQY